jgi:hypothetical protein
MTRPTPVAISPPASTYDEPSGRANRAAIAVLALGGRCSPLRVRGVDRVRLHVDLTILAKLACALSTARAAPLAA